MMRDERARSRRLDDSEIRMQISLYVLHRIRGKMKDEEAVAWKVHRTESRIDCREWIPRQGFRTDTHAAYCQRSCILLDANGARLNGL
jgi:hypothetical protein